MSEVATIDFKNIRIDLSEPTVLYDNGGHVVFWLGITDETAFRCNTYLIEVGDDAIIVDPGNRSFFDQVRVRVAQIRDPRQVTGMILCHQDPDVAASMVDWLEVNPKMRVFTTPRTNVLLPHYGRSHYNFYDVTENPVFELPSGNGLQFIEAPFLHFPGAFATYDKAAKFLYSGDIWAALNMDWTLSVKSFEEHINALDLFHIDYMASNVAARGFVERLKGLKIDAILPQHGSIIGPEHVPAAQEYLRNLQCGTDIVYASLS